MSFLFTFSFSVPGLRNPFSAASQPRTDDATHPTHQAHVSASNSVPCITCKDSAPLTPLPSSTSSAAPLSRKRGRKASSSSPGTVATVASTGGYLDVPAKRRAMSDSQREGGQEPTSDELQPTKRRRTLAGTIISTAVSAALIGTAVGLTVYRMWRDRGREFTIEARPVEEPEERQELHEDSYMYPPPPYRAEDYNSQLRPSVPSLSPKPRRRLNAPHHTSPLKRPPNVQCRRAVIAARQQTSIRSRDQPSCLTVPPRPEFDFGVKHHSGEAETDDVMDIEEGGGEEEAQLDRLGSQLEALLAAGRAALRSHVVVASEDPQDAVDDGGGDWVEEDDSIPVPSSLRRPRSGSLRRPRSGSMVATGLGGSLRRPKCSLAVPEPPSYSTSSQNHSMPSVSEPYGGPSSSYGIPSLVFPARSRAYTTSHQGSDPSDPAGMGAPLSTPSQTATEGPAGDSDSGTRARASSFHSLSAPAFASSLERGKEDSWASPELRASMERARARYQR